MRSIFLTQRRSIEDTHPYTVQRALKYIPIYKKMYEEETRPSPGTLRYSDEIALTPINIYEEKDEKVQNSNIRLTDYSLKLRVMSIFASRSLHTCIWTAGWIEDKVPQDFGPRAVLGKCVVVLGCKIFECRQVSTGNIGQIVMFHVIANVERNGIHGPIIGKRVAAAYVFKHEMFGNEVPGHGMNSHGDERTGEHVGERLDAAEEQNPKIENKLDNHIGVFEMGETFRTNAERAYGIEKRLAYEPEHLARRRREKSRLHSRRKIGIDALDAEIAMVFDVIAFERGGERDDDRKIGEDAEETIGEETALAERRVVRDVVYGEHHREIDYAAEPVGADRDREPRDARVRAYE